MGAGGHPSVPGTPAWPLPLAHSSHGEAVTGTSCSTGGGRGDVAGALAGGLGSTMARPWLLPRHPRGAEEGTEAQHAAGHSPCGPPLTPVRLRGPQTGLAGFRPQVGPQPQAPPARLPRTGLHVGPITPGEAHPSTYAHHTENHSRAQGTPQPTSEVGPRPTQGPQATHLVGSVSSLGASTRPHHGEQPGPWPCPHRPRCQQGCGPFLQDLSS